MAAMAAEAAATAAVPGDGGAGEAEPEMEPIPGSEAGADPLPAVSEAVESAVPDGEEADGGKAEEPPPVQRARSPGGTREPDAGRTEEPPRSPGVESPRAEPRAAAPSPGCSEPPQPCPPPEPDREPPQPCPPAAGGSAGPGEEPPRPEEEEPDAAAAAAVEPEPAVPAAPGGGEAEVPALLPGSEVRVTLDHIIEDALVVSFRLGEKLFSGVLMDLSKR